MILGFGYKKRDCKKFCFNAPFRCSKCNLQDPFDYCYGMETDCGKPYHNNNNNNFATKCGITVVR